MNIDNFRFLCHRGLFNQKDIPENSIKAFENAISNGYGIELDVQMTKDNYLVVFHDTSIKRMTGLKGNIQDLELKDIKKMSLLGTEQKIPTFSDVLLCVDKRVPILIEIKENNRYKEIMRKVMIELDRYNGEYMIESFDPKIVYWLKKNAPQVFRGQLSAKNVKEVKSRIVRFLLGKMVFNCITKPNFIAYQYLSVDKKFYDKQRKRGRYVAAWTVKNNNEYNKIRNNSDIIIFENIDTIKEA